MPFLLLGLLGGLLYGSLPALITVFVTVVLRRGQSVTFARVWLTSGIASIVTTLLTEFAEGRSLENSLSIVIAVLVVGTLAMLVAWQIAKALRILVPEASG